MYLWEVYIEVIFDTKTFYHKAVLVATDSYLALEKFRKSLNLKVGNLCTVIRVTFVPDDMYRLV